MTRYDITWHTKRKYWYTLGEVFTAS